MSPSIWIENHPNRTKELQTFFITEKAPAQVFFQAQILFEF